MTRAIALASALLMIGTVWPSLAQETDPLSLVQQGRRLSQEGKQDEALALFDKALAADPDLFDAHLASGISLDLVGRYAEAREHLTRAIELAPSGARSVALSAMAVSYAFESRAAEAAKFYQQIYDVAMAAEQPAGAAAISNALGRVYLEAGDTTNATRWYQTGYELGSSQPDEPGSQLALWEFRWLHAQGRIAAREGKAAEARAHVAKARELVASSPSLKDEGPTLAYMAGYVELFLGNHQAAAEELAKASQDDPFILMLEARAQEELGNDARARDYWQQVLTRHGHSLQNAFARPLARQALR